VAAGRIQAMREAEGGVEVEIVRRGTGSVETRTFDTVVNCTGPLGAMGRTSNPIVRQMLDADLVDVDELGIGLKVDGNDRAGQAVWAMGPMTKGRYWEIIAVPDIRGQAARVAEDIATELR
jgi:uncharacterized NAD(P)/FAD-binding protein YdhS